MHYSNKFNNNILFVKTFVDSGIGASLPEIELFISASVIDQYYPNKYNYTFFNFGYDYVDDDSFINLLKQKNIDCVIFYVNLLEKNLFHKYSNIIKQFDKNIIIIVSGQLASLSKHNILIDNNVDFVIFGEIYITLKELINALNNSIDLNKINGICYRINNTIVINECREFYENVDEFVISDKIWNVVDVTKYSEQLGWNGINQAKYYIPILASFGCPFSCSYCTNRLTLGNRFRKRSVIKIVDEIEHLVKFFSINEIHFFDSVFNFDKEWAKSILNEIIKRNLKIFISFPHGLRIDCMDEELIFLFEKAGVYKVTYAIETASLYLQKQINKNLDLEYARKIVAQTSKTSIIVCGYFMLGFPNETVDEMNLTIKYATESQFNIAAFFKYSDLYNSIDKKYNLEEDFIKFGYFSINNNIDNMKTNALLLTSQWKFYFSNNRLIKLYFKSKNKLLFIKQLIKFFVIIIYDYILYKALYEKYIKIL